jgi:DNA-binding transcriptional MerR regulator
VHDSSWKRGFISWDKTAKGPTMSLSDEVKLYTIQMAAKASGLSAHTIRAWEKRYAAITQQRSDSGRRLYSQEDVKRLILLVQLTNIGSAISQVASLPNEELSSIFNRLMKSTESPRSPLLPQQRDHSQIKVLLLEAVKTYDFAAVSVLLSEAKDSHTPRSLALDILLPVLDEMRAGCDGGTYQQAQMSALKSLIRFYAGMVIYKGAVVDGRVKSKYLIASLDQKNKDLSHLLSALICTGNKKAIFYLNTDVPMQTLADTIPATSSTHIILHVPKNTNAKLVENYLNDLSYHVPQNIKVWILSQTSIRKNLFKGFQLLKDHQQLDERLKSSDV